MLAQTAEPMKLATSTEAVQTASIRFTTLESRLGLVSAAQKATAAPLQSAWGCHAKLSDPRNVACHNMTHGSMHRYANGGLDLFLLQSFFCDVCNESRRTYVELGALDGMTASNTKMLEDSLNFQGVLIEGQPSNAHRLFAHRHGSGRNVIFPEAVCRTAGAATYVGRQGLGTAGVLEEMSTNYLKSWGHRFRNTSYSVPCRPIGEMLRLARSALGFKAIDFFSLDVEGAELLVLETFDWSIPVKLWLIELDGNDLQRNDVIREMLASHGYAPYISPAMLARTQHHFYVAQKGGNNEVFIHRDLLSSMPERVAACNKCTSRSRR
ncbi:hypothetical protein AB1Y20_013044 [Prymnesium parvum]|uniref:Methyltransferase FkbM domain-containing protein n=1 Tax=Prymnesium parvum TaxID=97485 RepID=A0AB34IMI3_PRYPA